MQITIDERRIKQIAREKLPSHVAEWWIIMQYGCDRRKIPAGLSQNALAKRLRVVQSTLHRNLKHAEQVMLEAINAERKQYNISLHYIGQPAETCASYLISLQEGHEVRTAIDVTQRDALERRK